MSKIFHSLIGGLGVRPAVKIVDVVMLDWGSVTQELLAVHAQGLVFQAQV